ncbi:hypothetical protein E4U42_004845 [Claviceps africana]|uniref:Glycosyl hydrolase family 32 N-terminal domain-containing protein n=1 Tax=Claviceps africana TaxID=83212 RepID=A0A8K0NFY3_9HYPO|nr:hypothetical protein E4U42_004845 [Claviceps africana]
MMLPMRTHLRPVVSLLVGALQLAAVVGATGRPAPEGDVTTGVAVVGDYTGKFRPQIHFSSPQNFLNDPNGMFRDDNGTWHLYYQHNPAALTFGNQHWGHATSQDLYHWTNQPIALQAHAKGFRAFTGNIVVDKNNTSGFFPNQKNGVVAMFTELDGTHGPLGTQSQSIAYSRDGGYTFTYYEHNPVIPSNSTQFRDPKIMWYEDHWVMTLVFADEFAVGIYTSPNMIDWTNVSNFTGDGFTGVQWECPNLLRVPTRDEKGQKTGHKWLLMVGINPRAPHGGSGTVYTTGTFNGTHFVADQAVPRLADFAQDNYAGQFFYGQPDDEEPVYMAWASNWHYTEVVPTAEEGWLSAVTLPRSVYISKLAGKDWNLFQNPYDMSPVMGDTVFSGEVLANQSVAVDFAGVESNAVYFEINMTGINQNSQARFSALEFNFSSPVTGEYVRGGYFLNFYNDFYVDRGGVRALDWGLFTNSHSTNSYYKADGTWSMSGVLDRSILEVFLNGGEDSGSILYYANAPLTVMNVGTKQVSASVRVSLRVVAVKSAWAKMASPDGLVYGNQTKVHSLLKNF